MLHHPTVDKLETLKLAGMARAYQEQLETRDIDKLAFEERFCLLLDREAIERDNRALQRRLKNARLRYAQACLEDLDYRPTRKLVRQQVNTLASCQWINEHRNILISGKTGVGKSYLACAFAHKACMTGYSAHYFRTSQLVAQLQLAQADGSYRRLLARIVKFDCLVLDDFGLSPMTKSHQHHLFDLLEERSERKSTIVASQYPVSQWYELFEEATLADAVLDRIVHNAYKIDVKGESMRKVRAKK